jgi:hypothetical protein
MRIADTKPSVDSSQNQIVDVRAMDNSTQTIGVVSSTIPVSDIATYLRDHVPIQRVQIAVTTPSGEKRFQEGMLFRMNPQPTKKIKL